MSGVKRVWYILVIGIAGSTWALAPVSARQFTEKDLACRGLLIIRDDTGRLHAQMHCQTEVRAFDLDIVPLLTGAQRTQLGNLYDGALTLVAGNETIVTPTPTITATPTLSATPTPITTTTPTTTLSETPSPTPTSTP